MSATGSTVDLPGATIDDQFTTDTGSEIVRLVVDDDTELHYIIGQFQDRGYDVNSVDFERNQISFAGDA